jgi:hypothetical protein
MNFSAGSISVSQQEKPPLKTKIMIQTILTICKFQPDIISRASRMRYRLVKIMKKGDSKDERAYKEY